MKIIQLGIFAIALFLLWLALSGFFDLFHVSLGVVSVAIVVGATWKLSLFPPPSKSTLGGDVWTCLPTTIRWRYALTYPLVFLCNVIKANIQVAALVLDPRMPIDPHLLKFKSTYKHDAAKILLGNSITLTPGTVTLDIRDQDFYVHALSPKLAASLVDGSDHNRVAKIFGEELLDKVELISADDPDDLK